MRDCRFLDTLDRRVVEYKYYSSSSSNKHHDHHRYPPYRRNDRGYLPDEFKKVNPPTFFGDVKKLEDAKTWILGMNKLFDFHDYTDNIKARVVIFILKGKVDIWWEDVKWVRDIITYDLSWWEFKRFFMKKYFSERYYNSKAKECYELKTGSMTEEECMTKFLVLLRYVPYLTNEKAKVQ